MSKYPQGTNCNSMQNDIDALQEQLDAALDELDYTNRGLAEWREVALEALAALRGVVVAGDMASMNNAIETAKNVVSKYPV